MPEQNVGMNKIIQSFWTGPLTTMECLCIRSFLENGHEFHLYTYERLEGVPKGTIVKDANEILPERYIGRFRYIQQFADFFRYALLLKKGGWWVDMDSVCLKPFDFSEEYVFVESTSDKSIGLNFAVIKVPLNSPLIQNCYDAVMKKESDWETMDFQAIGPELWARKITELKLTKYIKPIDMFDPVHWNRIAWIVDPEKTWNLKNSYALHLFHAAWNRGHQASVIKSESPFTDAKYPNGCLYEQLKRQYLPRISIVITTINRYKQLRKTFESFVRQSFKDYEVVVVDDGNDSETPAMCSEPWSFPIRYFRLNRIHIEGKRGCCVVSNYGVRRAFGEIIILQNAECLHVGEVIQNLVSKVNPGTVVLCKADHMNLDGTLNIEKTDYMNIVREYQALFFCGAIYKDWFEKLRGFDERYDNFYGADDIDFSDRLLFSGAKFEYLTDAYVQHQWHPIAGTNDARASEALLKSQTEVHKFLVKTTADMKSGKVSAVRNPDKPWGQIVDISVVITTFNRPALLQKTLASIRSQKVKNLEIIVVDDGTDTETKGICGAYGVVYVKMNRPQSEIYRNPALPINVGIRWALGDTIIVQNAECQHIDPNTIEKLVRQVTSDNAVFAKVISLSPDGKLDDLYCGKENPRPFFFCGAIRRLWFEKLRGFDEEYPGGGYDDDDFGDRLRKEGVKFIFTDVEVHHQWHPHLGILNDRLAREMYLKKSGAMVAETLGTVRNLTKEWGILEPIVVSSPAKSPIVSTPPPCNCEDCRKKRSLPPPPPPPPPPPKPAVPCECPDCKKKRAGK